MLWTTRYLDTAVTELRALPADEREHDVREHDVLDEDVARLSPLKHANLNVFGRYTFRASTPVGGALRPLRDPAADAEDDERPRGAPVLRVCPPSSPAVVGRGCAGATGRPRGSVSFRGRSGVVSSAESCRRARAARPCAPPEQYGVYSGRGRCPITFWPTNADIRRAW